MEKPNHPSVKCDHTPPAGFQPGNSVSLTLRPNGAVPAARLYYRRVTHAERWQVVDMERDGQGFKAAIPADYTRSPYPLEYYFELRRDPAAAWLYPGFAADLGNQPYHALMPKGRGDRLNAPWPLSLIGSNGWPHEATGETAYRTDCRFQGEACVYTVQP